VTEQTLFFIFAILAGGGAIGVVILQDIVRMAFSLIISLGSTAGLFFLLGADFVAATQLLVYVGGTLVLLIFGVMLTASGPFRRIKMSSGETLLGAAVGLRLVGIPADAEIGLHKGSGSRTGYLLPFEIVSVHLLVVLVGAAYLARAKRHESRDAAEGDA